MAEQVFKTKRKSDNSTVTVKILSGKQNPKFSYEAEMLQKFSHPNILNIIDLFVEDDKIYLIMPSYEYDNLDRFLKTDNI